MPIPEIAKNKLQPADVYMIICSQAASTDAHVINEGLSLYDNVDNDKQGHTV